MARVLIIKLSSLGDVIHALPAVHAIKQGLHAEIDWVTQTEYVDLVNCFSDVDRVIPFDRRRFFRTLRGFTRDLRECDYNYIIDLQGLLKSAVAARLARGERRIGPSFHREGSSLLYHEVAGDRNRQRHAVVENMDIVQHLHLPEIEPEFHLQFPDWEPDLPSPRIAILPCSRWKSKNWPAASFITVARTLWEERAASLYLLGSEADRKVCDNIAGQLGGAVENLCGQTSIVQMGSILSQMDLVITNDSGPMHIAAALGKPVLAFYGPTDPKRTGPYGRWHRVMNASIQCQPCFQSECRYGDPRCMNVLSPQEAAETALSMID